MVGGRFALIIGATLIFGPIFGIGPYDIGAGYSTIGLPLFMAKFIEFLWLSIVL